MSPLQEEELVIQEEVIETPEQESQHVGPSQGPQEEDLGVPVIQEEAIETPEEEPRIAASSQGPQEDELLIQEDLMEASEEAPRNVASSRGPEEHATIVELEEGTGEEELVIQEEVVEAPEEEPQNVVSSQGPQEEEVVIQEEVIDALEEEPRKVASSHEPEEHVIQEQEIEPQNVASLLGPDEIVIQQEVVSAHVEAPADVASSEGPDEIVVQEEATEAQEEAPQQVASSQGKQEVIDLSLDSDEDDSIDEPITPQASPEAPEREVIDVDSEDEDEVLVHLGSCEFSIVENGSFEGKAHLGEFVNFARDSRNAADKYTVWVVNMRHQKVGKVSSDQVKLLIVVLDRLWHKVKVDGTIPRPGDDSTIPVKTDFYARNCGPLELHKVSSLMHHIFSRFPTYRSAVAKPIEIVDLTAAPEVETETMDWERQQKQLDDMFEKESREKLANLPDIQLPTQFTDGTQLFEHQEIGIRWMVQRETEDLPVPFFKRILERGMYLWQSEITRCSQMDEPKSVKGGILADDMGLGKTLQLLGLILSNPPPGRQYATSEEDTKPQFVAHEDTNSSSMTPDLTQDVAKLGDQPDLGSAVSVPVAKKQRTVEAFAASASYQASSHGMEATGMQFAAASYANAVAAASRPGSYQEMPAPNTSNFYGFAHLPQHYGLQSEPVQQIANYARAHEAAQFPQHYGLQTEQLDWVQQIANGASPNEPTSSICTLIVSPVSVMSNWVHQIENHIKDGVLRHAIYHGANRDSIIAQVQGHELDVLIVSYNTLASDYTKKHGDGKKKSKGENSKPSAFDGPSLFDLRFHRVILDEAHIIRNMKTRMYKACTALETTFRWCLTGTPLQNKPDDINALFAFLQVEPLGDKDVFRRAISQPVEEGDESGLARLRAMMAHLALRRNKTLVKLKVPNKEVQICRVSFPDGVHKSVHDTLFATARTAFEVTLREGEDQVLKSFSSIFESLLRIRQSCCSGMLVPLERRERAKQVFDELEKSQGGALSADDGRAILEKLKGSLGDHTPDETSLACSVCLCEMDENAAIMIRICSHVFCESCTNKVMSMGGVTTCPLCRVPFQREHLARISAATKAVSAVPEVSICVDNMGPPPKILALMEAIMQMGIDEKGVIFSQFTSFLDLIGDHLTKCRHTFARIDGSKNASDRIKSIRNFSIADGGPRFMLCSLHAAGTGINLTRGNHIFMMDPWWNQAVENQAFDRCHRIGQKRDVKVYRFIMSGSVEERMVALQEAKATVGKGSMEKLNSEEVRKARIGDLKSLFNISANDSRPMNNEASAPW